MARKQKYPQEQKQKYFVKPLQSKNYSQEQYVESLNHARVTFCLGPAGTGKTYVAAHVALTRLFNQDVSKIIITRPIVATEDIGYLPGTLDEKIHPYLLPLLDSFEDHIGPAKLKELFELHMIEVAPLAFLRGRSLNNSFVLLDEAQNTTKEQMKMFLTRMGHHTQLAINGDMSQSDLGVSTETGLQWAVNRLRGVNEEIDVIEFYKKDIIRDPLIETMLTYLDGPPR
jgi:phosphate starvation-inducible PhoH-like protein